MRDVTAPRAAAVLSAKVAGTLHLRERYAGGARLVCFSSSSAELGVVGQATYGAANAFVDELCGGDAIQWGGWAEAGMAADHDIQPLAGERFLPVSRGLAALGALLDAAPRRAAPTLVLDVDWPAYQANTTIISEAERLLGRADRPAAAARRAEGALGAHARVGAMHAYTLRLGEGEGAWRQLLQHVVDGKPVLPASGYVCWALQVLAALGAAAPALRDVRFVRVLDLAAPRTCTLALTPDPLHTGDEAGGGRGGGGGGGSGTGAHLRGTIVITCEGRVHAAMSYECGAAGRASAATGGAHAGGGAEDDDEGVEAEDEEVVDAPYALFGEQGFEYGPDFAQLRDVRVRGARPGHGGARASAALASAPPPRGATAAAPLGPLCAGALDSALQLASFVDGAAAFGVPTRIEAVTWLRPLEAARRATARPAAAGGGGFDVTLLGGDGLPVAVVRRMAMLALHSSTPFSIRTVRALQPAASALEPPALAGAFDTAADQASRQVGRLQPLATLRRLGVAAAAQPAVVLRLSEAPLSADAAVRAAAAADVAILVGGAMDAVIPVVDARGHLLSEDLQPLPPPAAADLVDAATPYVAVVDAEVGRGPTHRTSCPPPPHTHRTPYPSRRPSKPHGNTATGRRQLHCRTPAES